jgi:hypothetical protein
MNEDLFTDYGKPARYKHGKKIYTIVEKSIENSKTLHMTIVKYRIIARGFNRWVEADRLVYVK